MRKSLLILFTGLIAAVTLAASAWAWPQPVLRDPPDFQRFEPESPGLRIKRNREQVEEFRQVPVPEEPKRKTPPEQPPKEGDKNEK